ncbi:hypothetical protein CYMTET_41357 [Cymbomonas tetramitiformis]|uniref:Uncharacterized protein n=1 Tax=Cymbomonas tetramitiformis TaxID=36881 RepID=A0AAE0C677_9CHLO|nr:hypothetical protein CYMTET_41357 [Cymbomonas tetramitiformis]
MSSRVIEVRSFTVGLISGLAIGICYRFFGFRFERLFGSTNTEDKTGARQNLKSEELEQSPSKPQVKRKRRKTSRSATVGNCGLGDAWAEVQFFDSAQGMNLQNVEQLSWKTNAVSDEGRAVTRWVHCCDALAWIKSQTAFTEQVITSLPDICELPDCGNSVHIYCEWFKETCEIILQKSAPSAIVIFYQSDFKRDGIWVDKSHLCNVAAERAQSKLLWHKIVCINAPGSSRFGRPTYTHMLAFSKQVLIKSWSPGTQFHHIQLSGTWLFRLLP